MIAWALIAALLASEPPPDTAPVFLATSVRVHLHASEELDPDYLRAFARKNVVLWLSTRTNTLRASTLESIAKFDDAWIFLRAPVRDSDARQLSKVPRAGLWLDFNDLDGARRVLGPRRLAINLIGPLDEATFDKLQSLRPAETSWAAPVLVDLLSWSLFRQLPGRKILLRNPGEPLPADCPENPGTGEPTLQSRSGLNPGGFPCGRGPRIEVPWDIDRTVLKGLLVREPSTELVVRLGDDPRMVSKVRRLLDDLGLK